MERDIKILTEVLEHRLVRDDEHEEFVSYRLRRETAKWRTTRWQVLAVAVGARMAGFLRGTRFLSEVEPLLSQLQGALPSGQRLDISRLRHKVHVVTTGHKRYDQSGAHQHVLAVMVDSLLAGFQVDLEYLSSARAAAGQVARPMRVQPLCLTLHRGAVYFIVDEVGPDAESTRRRRQLALDRCTGAKLLVDEPAFTHPTDFSAHEFYADAFAIWSGQGAYEVCLRFDQIYSTFVLERSWHPTQRASTDDKGRLLLQFEVSELREVEDWVLGMAEHVEVLAPESLRAGVQSRLTAALTRYNEGAHAGAT